MKVTVRLGVTKALAFLALLLFNGAVMADTDTKDVLSFDEGTPITGGVSHLTASPDDADKGSRI
jgi:hypothetical protein